MGRTLQGMQSEPGAVRLNSTPYDAPDAPDGLKTDSQELDESCPGELYGNHEQVQSDWKQIAEVLDWESNPGLNIRLLDTYWMSTQIHFSR